MKTIRVVFCALLIGAVCTPQELLAKRKKDEPDASAPLTFEQSCTESEPGTLSGGRPLRILGAMVYFGPEETPADFGFDFNLPLDVLGGTTADPEAGVDDYWRLTSFGNVDFAEFVVCDSYDLGAPPHNLSPTYDPDVVRDAAALALKLDSQAGTAPLRCRAWDDRFNGVDPLAGGSLSVDDWDVFAVFTTWEGYFGKAMGSTIWLAKGGVTRFVVSHEIGHTLGFPHAGNIECSCTAVPVSGADTSCSGDPYGNPFSIMGKGAGHVDAYHKLLAGWLTPSDVVEIPVASAGPFVFDLGVDLEPQETAPSGIPKAIRIVREGGSTGVLGDVLLEYRQPTDSFEETLGVNSPVFNGVLLYLLPENPVYWNTNVIGSLRPVGSWTQAPLEIDEGTFVDPAEDINGRFLHITVENDGANGRLIIERKLRPICGDVNGDQVVNSADIIYLLNYVVDGGAAPPHPLIRADVDGDGAVSFADISALIDYVYTSGPAPICDIVQPFVGPLDIAAGGGHTCAIDASGLGCWGLNSSGQVDVPSMADPVQVVAGDLITCGVDEAAGSRNVRCWGENTFGTTVVPDRVSAHLHGEAPYHLAANLMTACAVIDTGTPEDTIDCWGYAGLSSPRPPVSPEDVLQIDVGEDQGCVLDALHDITCWAPFDTQPFGSNPLPGMSSPQRIAVGNGFVCGLDGVDVLCSEGAPPVRQDYINSPYEIAAGDRWVCAANQPSTYGYIVCWSDDSVEYISRTANVRSMSIGSDGHVCARYTDPYTGTDEMNCWGDNNVYGQTEICAGYSFTGQFPAP